jgi:hypothetical protein
MMAEEGPRYKYRGEGVFMCRHGDHDLYVRKGYGLYNWGVVEVITGDGGAGRAYSLVQSEYYDMLQKGLTPELIGRAIMTCALLFGTTTNIGHEDDEQAIS